MQNINLYQPERITGLRPPSLPLLVLLLAALLVVVLADTGWQLWQLRQSNAQLQLLQQEVVQAEQALAAVQRDFREPQSDPLLPGQVAAIEQEQRQLQWLAQYVQQLDGQRTGFSSLLDGLAGQHLPGIWLREFHFLAGGRQLELQGATRQQQLLTDYLASLGRSPVFAGREFASLQMDRDGGGNLLFWLSSQATRQKENK